MTPNDKMKMKALHKMFQDIDGLHDQALTSKFKPKKAVVEESVAVVPKHEGSPLDEKALPEGLPGAAPKPDMDDEDTRRLMELYQGLK